MNILVTLDFPPEIGGIQGYLRGIVEHTFGPNDMVLVGCGRLKGRPHSGPGPAISYVSTFLSWFNKKWSLFALAVRLLLLMVRTREPLCVTCGNVYAALVPWVLGPAVRVPYTVYIYGTELSGLGERTLKRRLLVAVLSSAQRLIAISAYSVSLARTLGVAKPMEILPPRISLPEIGVHTSAQSFAGSNFPPQAVRLLCVGRLVPHKGHTVLLSAAASLPATMAWRLVIVGKGPLRQPLAMQSARLGIADRVTFRSDIAAGELEKEYRAATLFVLPSVTDGGVEGFGIVLLEAMAYRIPIIASACGGIPEVLDNGSCGILVPPQNPQALTQAIVRLVRDPRLREDLVLHAGERLVERYVWS